MTRLLAPALVLAAALAVLPAAASAQAPADPAAVEAAAERLGAGIEQTIELHLDDEDLEAISEAATTFALNLLEAIDVEALTRQAVTGSLAAVGGLATNGAWAKPDPDQMVTYGLMADYALNAAAEDAEDE